jgi:ABC-type transport system involved in multi-copper enzyme maturation permease subunit
MLEIFLHELRLFVREPRFWVPFLLPPVFLVAMNVFLYARMDGSQGNLDPGLALLTGVLLSTISVALTSDSFAGERERNTLELLLTLPIGVKNIFWGKLLALLPLPLGFACGSQILLWFFSGTLPDSFLALSLAYVVSVTLLVTGFSLLVSLYSKTVRSAAQTNVFFVLACLGLTQAFGGDYLKGSWTYGLLLPMSGVVFAVLVWMSLRNFEVHLAQRNPK